MHHQTRKEMSRCIMNISLRHQQKILILPYSLKAIDLLVRLKVFSGYEATISLREEIVLWMNKIAKFLYQVTHQSRNQTTLLLYFLNKELEQSYRMAWRFWGKNHPIMKKIWQNSVPGTKNIKNVKKSLENFRTKQWYSFFVSLNYTISAYCKVCWPSTDKNSVNLILIWG